MKCKRRQEETEVQKADRALRIGVCVCVHRRRGVGECCKHETNTVESKIESKHRLS